MAQKYFGRVGWVSIEDDGGTMRSYAGTAGGGLDFKFSGKKLGSVYTEFNVSILGLNSDTINSLAVWNPGEAITRKRRIEVYAGYQDSQPTQPIFHGIVFEAIPTNPPEMWLNMFCRNITGGDKYEEGAYGVSNYRDIELKQVKLDVIVNTICEILEVDLGDSDSDTMAKLAEKKFDFLYHGDASGLCDYFAYQFGVLAYIENNSLIISDRRPWLKDAKDPFDVSIDTGMLGVSELSMRGCNIKRRLDDSVPLMGWVNLKSTLIPKANGNYCVLSKTHTGHFRGNEWFTELECIRQGAVI